MIQGETYPIAIKITTDPQIAAADIEGAIISIYNNRKETLLFDLDTLNQDADGEVTVDDSTGTLFVKAVCEPEQTKDFLAGQLQIELKMKVAVGIGNFPAGYVRVAQFVEPVLKSQTTSEEL
jgi:hypothetical protein